MRESTIEAHLVKRVKELGGECRKVTWPGRRGAPDRLVMLPPVHHPRWDGTLVPAALAWAEAWTKPAATIWVELKAPGLKAEPHQLREHKRMQAMGQRVVVVDSIEGVEALLA